MRITIHWQPSVDADFWNQRWQNNQIAFHQGRVNPLLDTHFGELALIPGDRVFVPLCGKAIDMRWPIDRGATLYDSRSGNFGDIHHPVT